jgi:hypothetical protein
MQTVGGDVGHSGVYRKNPAFQPHQQNPTNTATAAFHLRTHKRIHDELAQDDLHHPQNWRGQHARAPCLH